MTRLAGELLSPVKVRVAHLANESESKILKLQATMRRANHETMTYTVQLWDMIRPHIASSMAMQLVTRDNRLPKEPFETGWNQGTGQCASPEHSSMPSFTQQRLPKLTGYRPRPAIRSCSTAVVCCAIRWISNQNIPKWQLQSIAWPEPPSSQDGQS